MIGTIVSERCDACKQEKRRQQARLGKGWSVGGYDGWLEKG